MAAASVELCEQNPRYRELTGKTFEFARKDRFLRANRPVFFSCLRTDHRLPETGELGAPIREQCRPEQSAFSPEQARVFADRHKGAATQISAKRKPVRKTNPRNARRRRAAPHPDLLAIVSLRDKVGESAGEEISGADGEPCGQDTLIGLAPVCAGGPNREEGQPDRGDHDQLASLNPDIEHQQGGVSRGKTQRQSWRK